MSFAADMARIVKKHSLHMEELVRNVKLDLFSGIIDETRVATGRLRGNWQMQENTPASGTIDRVDPSGAAVTAEIHQKVTGDGVTYFVNNLPYAAVWEREDGMIIKNIARVRGNIKRMAQ